jgi:hypothetical protein
MELCWATIPLRWPTNPTTDAVRCDRKGALILTVARPKTSMPLFRTHFRPSKGPPELSPGPSPAASRSRSVLDREVRRLKARRLCLGVRESSTASCEGTLYLPHRCRR